MTALVPFPNFVFPVSILPILPILWRDLPAYGILNEIGAE